MLPLQRNPHPDVPATLLAGRQAMRRQFGLVRDEILRVLRGRDAVVDLALWTLLAQGHILLEGYHGLGKTTLAKALAKVMGLPERRVQFTSDLLPGDITGSSVFDPSRQAFVFHPGPLFTHVFLADEINRGSPRTQSALLEAMAERQVSVDGTTTALARPFLVLATQNPSESTGVFPLPESQMDRFMVRLPMLPPTDRDEIALLLGQAPDVARPIWSADGLLAAQTDVARVHVAPAVAGYVQRLLTATRHDDGGLSTRAGLAVLAVARARAWSRQRDFVEPDDVREVFEPVAAHRMGREGVARARAALAETPLEAEGAGVC